MYHTIQKIAVIVLVISVSALTFVAVLSIWEVFKSDVLWKSISTIGVLAFAAVVIMLAARFMEEHQSKMQ